MQRGVFGTLMSEYVIGYMLEHERRMLARYAAQQAEGGPNCLSARQEARPAGRDHWCGDSAWMRHFGMHAAARRLVRTWKPTFTATTCELSPPISTIW